MALRAIPYQHPVCDCVSRAQMDKLINTSLLSPRNLLVIGVISIVAHAVAKPLYKAVANKAGN